MIVVPSSTLPIRGTAPAANSSASASVVLPAPPCPTSATLRILSDDTVMLALPMLLLVGIRRPRFLWPRSPLPVWRPVPPERLRGVYGRASGGSRGDLLPSLRSFPAALADRRARWTGSTEPGSDTGLTTGLTTG